MSLIVEWSLGERLRKARQSAGISPEDMAARVGISRASLGNYEHDRREPRLAVLQAWAEECTPDGDDVRDTWEWLTASTKWYSPPSRAA